jgi:hypothetical protein
MDLSWTRSEHRVGWGGPYRSTLDDVLNGEEVSGICGHCQVMFWSDASTL